MNKSGQIVLILLSVLYGAWQSAVYHRPFFTIGFCLFTSVAWMIGWQYDKTRYYEKKARAGEESYKHLLDSLPKSVIIHHDFDIVYVNKAAIAMFRASRKEELMGKSVFDLIAPEYKNRTIERIKQIKKESQPLHNIEYKVRRLDGSSFFFELSSMQIIYGKKNAIISIGKDITERKEETERLLQKSEKLALLGEMAAGIAHEIRNPLTSIKGFIQLFHASHPEEQYVEIVLTELEQINSIVGEFLMLAKPSASVFMANDIVHLLKDVITMMSAQSVLNQVQIYVEYEGSLPKVNCEENQLKQVFLNILENSIEAMPFGGNIEIKVREKEEGEISIVIADEGVGIPQNRISTLGEPFYTTKEKGTGLGLMTCYKIIESHHGKLNISSKEKEGTTVEIILPTITQPLLLNA